MKKIPIFLTLAFCIGCSNQVVFERQDMDYITTYGLVMSKNIVSGGSDNKQHYYISVRVEKITKYEKDEKGNRYKKTIICSDPPVVMELSKEYYDKYYIGQTYIVKAWFN